jgi:hypothetical protein
MPPPVNPQLDYLARKYVEDKISILIAETAIRAFEKINLN